MGSKLICLGVIILFSVPLLLAQERARVEVPYPEGTLVIDADQLIREGAEWLAQGRVVVTYADVVLKANRLRYDPSTRKAIAEGEVEVTRGLQWLKANRAEWNLGDDTGSLYVVKGFTADQLYIDAYKVVKTGRDTYLAYDGILTACEEAIPKWSFTIRKASIRTQSSAHFTHTLFRIKKIPVFYLPLVILPTGKKKRSSGFLLPTTGISKNKGRRIGGSFYLVLGRSADLMIQQDYFSKRGFGQGFTLRTRPSEVSHLELNGYWVNDRMDQGGAMLNAIGKTRFKNGFRAVADFNLTSNFIFRRVFSDDFDTATRPYENSRIFFTKNSRSRSLNFLVSREETVFPGRNIVTRNTPALQFKLTGQRLGNSPIYLDLRSSVEGLSRADRQIETPGISQRLDIFPQLYFSLPLFQGLRLTPRLGVRETFYSDSLEPPDDEDSEVSLSPENVDRKYLELTLDLKGWGLSKVYNRSHLNWKHLIEPVLRYRYITSIDEFHQIIRFDEHDAIVGTNEIEYGLFNRILVKKANREGSPTREWLSVKLAQKHFFDSDFGGSFRPGAVNQFFPLNTLTGFPYGGLQRDWSPLTTLVRITPNRTTGLDLRGDYDVKLRKLRNFSLTGSLRRGKLFLGTTYFNTRKLEIGTFNRNQIQSHIGIGSLERGFSISGVFSYNLTLSRFLNYRSRLNYFWDCCGISLEHQGFNLNIRQERQLRFSFFLKGIGGFGTIKNPYSIF